MPFVTGLPQLPKGLTLNSRQRRAALRVRLLIAAAASQELEYTSISCTPAPNICNQQAHERVDLIGFGA